MANETIIINDDLRTMQIPSSIVLLGVESDDDVNKIPFQMPKEYCGFDLSTFEARINYMNANGIGDIYIVDDLEIDGDDPSMMNFTWLVGRNACAYKGDTKFIVCLKKFDEDQNVVQEFNTTVYTLPVLEGLETVDAVVQQNPDIIEYILKLIEDSGGVDLSNYYTKAQVDALKLANPYKLTINGVDYDGSEAVEMTIDGESQTAETANGQIVHVEDAVPNTAVKSLSLLDSNASAIETANVAVTNKNLFRLDLIASQTVSKGITFEKNADGAIKASGTSTGTYAAAQAEIDAGAFVVGETYTISSGKSSGVLYVQLIMNYTDGTTDYLVASNSPSTFTLAKAVSSVIGSVQLTASGVTVDEWIYPMVELSDMASAFEMNTYASVTYDGDPSVITLPDSICNIWSNTSTVDNIVMEYWNDPVMARINELEKEFNQTIEHDGELDTTSVKAVQNKVVTAALNAKANSAYVETALANKVSAQYTDSAVTNNLYLEKLNDINQLIEPINLQTIRDCRLKGFQFRSGAKNHVFIERCYFYGNDVTPVFDFDSENWVGSLKVIGCESYNRPYFLTADSADMTDVYFNLCTIEGAKKFADMKQNAIIRIDSCYIGDQKSTDSADAPYIEMTDNSKLIITNSQFGSDSKGGQPFIKCDAGCQVLIKDSNLIMSNQAEPYASRFINYGGVPFDGEVGCDFVLDNVTWNVIPKRVNYNHNAIALACRKDKWRPTSNTPVKNYMKNPFFLDPTAVYSAWVDVTEDSTSPFYEYYNPYGGHIYSCGNTQQEFGFNWEIPKKMVGRTFYFVLFLNAQVYTTSTPYFGGAYTTNCEYVNWTQTGANNMVAPSSLESDNIYTPFLNMRKIICTDTTGTIGFGRNGATAYISGMALVAEEDINKFPIYDNVWD